MWSARRRFQSGEGPSRRLLRDCTTSPMDRFEALVIFSSSPFRIPPICQDSIHVAQWTTSPPDSHDPGYLFFSLIFSRFSRAEQTQDIAYCVDTVMISLPISHSYNPCFSSSLLAALLSSPLLHHSAFQSLYKHQNMLYAISSFIFSKTKIWRN